MNATVQMHVKNVLKILAVVGHYADGNFTPVLERLPGKQVFANEKLDTLRLNLQNLVNDIGLLAKAAVEGNLDARTDASNH